MADYNNSFICDEMNQEMCEHKEYLAQNKNKNSNKFYLFCFKCSNIVLLDGDKTYTTSKINFDDDGNNLATELDPILLIRHMIKRQDYQIKMMNKKFSTTNPDYSNERNKLLIFLHKLCCKLKYSDNTFYLALFLLDTFFSTIDTKDMTNKDLFLKVLGFFLISSKYIESDIFEPEFEMFCNMNRNITINVDEIETTQN